MNMKRKTINTAIFCLLAGVAGIGLSPSVVTAANNSLSNVSALENGVQYLDLTLNTDWDYDANVIQKGTASKETPTVLNRQYLENLINQTARMLFVMTDGKHRIGKVYVFKNGKYGANVDIRVLNTPGRANADGAGWRADGGLTTNNYITNCNVDTCSNTSADSDLDPENFVQTGEVIAHELGHYVYGLYDEYVENGKACSGKPEEALVPCQDDVTRPTAMNNQAASYRLSTSGDYPSNDFAKTAQGRVYGKSAWETLVSDPANDTDVAKETHGGRRTYFDAFKNLGVPEIASLRSFTQSPSDGIENANMRLARQTAGGAEVAKFNGYDTKLQIVFEGTADNSQPRNVIVIDRTVPGATFNQIIEAAKGLVDRAPSNASFALVTNPENGTSTFRVMNEANKTTLKATLDQLTSAGGNFDLQAAYNRGKALVAAARPAAGQVENAGNTDTFTLYTLSNKSVPENLGTTARNDKIAFNIVGFKAPIESSAVPASTNSFANLAKDSGGKNNTAKSANDAIKKASYALQASMGETESLISADLSDEKIQTGQSFESTFLVGDTAVDGPVEVRWYFSRVDQNKLTFECVSPNGTVLPNNPVEMLSDEEGVASCTIGNARATGTWTARAKSNAISDAVELEVVSQLAGAPVELNASIEGGTKDDPRQPALLVKMAGSFPVINANITAAIFDAESDSEVPVKTFMLNSTNDAGTNGDARANDGIYTMSLVNQLKAGSYFVALSATTNGSSMFNPVQIFVSSSKPAPGARPVGSPIERLSEGEFDFEQGAPGVVAASMTTPVGNVAAGGGGGGCTTGGGNDAGLLGLMSLAVLRLLRRRVKSGHSAGAV